jgi:hypothetical protein
MSEEEKGVVKLKARTLTIALAEELLAEVKETQREIDSLPQRVSRQAASLSRSCVP